MPFPTTAATGPATAHHESYRISTARVAAAQGTAARPCAVLCVVVQVISVGLKTLSHTHITGVIVLVVPGALYTLSLYYWHLYVFGRNTR